LGAINPLRRTVPDTSPQGGRWGKNRKIRQTQVKQKEIKVGFPCMVIIYHSPI
jgi:hypothetical protein